MYGKIIVLFLGLISSLSSETLQELESLSPNPLYFNIPVTHYRIEKIEVCPESNSEAKACTTHDYCSQGNANCENGSQCLVSLTIKLPSKQITVITDRPIKETSRVTTQEFVEYASTTEKSGLVFTIDIRQGDKIFPANFTVECITYDADNDMLTAISKLNIQDDNVVNQLNTSGLVAGDTAVLNVEG